MSATEILMALAPGLTLAKAIFDATSSYFDKELAVLDLLKEYLNAQGKILDVQVRITKEIEVDAISRSGVDLLAGPTIFSIKKGIESLHDFQEKIQFITMSAKIIGAQSAVLILLNDPPVGIINNLGNITTSFKNIEIWSANKEIKKIVQYLSEASIAESASASQRTVAEADGAGEKQWRHLRSRFVHELKSAYSQDELVLFLGAGVSQEAGVPTWNALLADLLAAVVTKSANDGYNAKDISTVVSRLQERHGASPLLLARYIRAGLGEVFPDRLSTALYKNLKKPLSQYANLLNSIARICRPRRGSASLRAVVTYNFDDLLETRLTEMSVDHRAIYRERDVPRSDEIGIFHVHGYLPRNERKNEISDSILVFSEEGYHSVFMDPYSWSNIVQLNFLRQSTCLLVGLSAQDPNLRRLAEFIAKKIKRSKHYIILKRDKMENAENPKIAQLYDELHHGLQEISLCELGFNVLWVESYDEIPTIIDSIHERSAS